MDEPDGGVGVGRMSKAGDKDDPVLPVILSREHSAGGFEVSIRLAERIGHDGTDNGGWCQSANDSGFLLRWVKDKVRVAPDPGFAGPHGAGRQAQTDVPGKRRLRLHSQKMQIMTVIRDTGRGARS